MTKPCIICVAITGSLPTKANNPAVPITIAEQIESTHEAFEAGARRPGVTASEETVRQAAEEAGLRVLQVERSERRGSPTFRAVLERV